MRPEINFSKIQIGGGVAGSLIAISVIAIALVGIPAARWFLAGSVLVGALVALILRLTDRSRP
jgi:hypothetical protein